MGKRTGKIVEKYDVRSIVTVFLWDMPALVENPEKFLQIVNRFRAGNLNPEDRVVISTFRDRVLKTEGGSAIYKRIFGEEVTDSCKKWFTSPDELYARLKEKFGSSTV